MLEGFEPSTSTLPRTALYQTELQHYYGKLTAKLVRRVGFEPTLSFRDSRFTVCRHKPLAHLHICYFLVYVLYSLLFTEQVIYT